MSLPSLLTSKEFAAYLKLKENGKKTVEKWARAGKLKNIAIPMGTGRRTHWVFPEDKVIQFIERGGMRR